MSEIFIPYGRHFLDESDVAAVAEVLRSDWLTTGGKGAEFEAAVADYVEVAYAVAVSSGSAALHCALLAAGVGVGDEVILPTLTFIADASMVASLGACPVLADVNQADLLINIKDVEKKITSRTKALLAVDYAGQPCDYISLRRLAERNGLCLIADACHSLGASQAGCKVGSLADMTVFSFHPVKHITTGEGGMVVTDKADLAEKIRRYRNHGITVDHQQRSRLATWEYDIKTFGCNYRLSDFQSALGLSQLKKLPSWLLRRQEIARCYDLAFKDSPYITPLGVASCTEHSYHLYVIRLILDKAMLAKEEIFKEFRRVGIGVNVHYKPLNLMTVMQQKYGCKSGDFPVAEKAYAEILSLPIYPAMPDKDVQTVIDNCLRIVSLKR